MNQTQYEKELEILRIRLTEDLDMMQTLCSFKSDCVDRLDERGYSGTPLYENAEEAYNALGVNCDTLQEAIEDLERLQLLEMEN